MKKVLKPRGQVDNLRSVVPSIISLTKSIVKYLVRLLVQYKIILAEKDN